MQTINVHEAKTHLSRLLNRVSAGEEFIIAKAGKPIARLTGLRETVLKRKPGLDRGKFLVPDDFDAPLSDGVLDDFET
ncbi:MAG: type II toxin-antitoxin system Phd/YefM family antitoxin [Desulfobacteraceae bacterium]|uniref:Antitoxin n=1 Tax=Candidatus Desulfacyla euxinica TaxID=2841693 RepID=A0A8J6T9I2_9DELT|nr:type II toxin-antitoxin system Phd/YefM family antitoxin [Candidatus Desulfacyla euxinica]MBL6977876.1 type II toxin-antitoxin system Phd/YefM family antitoxin [Desulfobacteraceae bacterium]